MKEEGQSSPVGSTYQDPVPNSAAIDTAATLCPDSDGERPCKEDNKGLRKMDDVLRPPQTPAR